MRGSYGAPGEGVECSSLGEQPGGSPRGWAQLATWRKDSLRGWRRSRDRGCAEQSLMSESRYLGLSREQSDSQKPTKGFKQDGDLI